MEDERKSPDIDAMCERVMAEFTALMSEGFVGWERALVWSLLREIYLGAPDPSGDVEEG